MHEPSVLSRLPLRARLAAFGRDEAGTVVAEAVIILPLFIWAYIALFAYWDSFRSLNTVQKAAFTVSDRFTFKDPTPIEWRLQSDSPFEVGSGELPVDLRH